MRALPSLLCSVAVCLGVAGCEEAPPPARPAEQAAAVAEEATRKFRESAEREMNPKGLPVYSGPVGAVRGTVKVTGDEPPLSREMGEKLPAQGCPRAHELHRKLFRQGSGRTLADVLVTVTEYQGYLPPRGEAVRIEAKGCAFGARVLAATYGQRLDVYNLDAQPYMPRLIGTPTYALRVAMPGGPPVPVFPPKPGQYMLVDQTREYMRSDLFVLQYPTFDVTGLDGTFEIGGIPAGAVVVHAYAPALGKVVQERVEVKAGQTHELSFEIEFSAEEHQRLMTQSAPAATPPSAGPVSEPH